MRSLLDGWNRARDCWNRMVARLSTSNPIAKVAKADQKADPRRKHRSMTETELGRLLYVATWRPIAEFGRVTQRKDPSEVKRKRDTWKLAPLTFDDLPAAIDRGRQRLEKKNPEFLAKLEIRGRQRALVYKTLVLTGLRRGELASLTVGQLHLDSPVPHADLYAADEKNRDGSEIPLRADLAQDLRAWLSEKLQAHQQTITGSGKQTVPMSGLPDKLPASEPLFDVPRQLVKTLNRDLAAAGIEKTDDRGRTLDVHALRHSFGTLLSAGGVAPRTAQAAMRHSSIDLTMNIYTDPRLLDVHGALETLPDLPLGKPPHHEAHSAQATGTDHPWPINPSPTVAPTVAPNPGNLCKLGTIPDKMAGDGQPASAKENPGKTSVSRGFQQHAREDSNLQPLVPKTSALSN